MHPYPAQRTDQRMTMATPKTTVNPKAPLSVLFVAGLSTVEAVYLLFRGVADPLFGDAARAVQERLVGGIIQAFFGLIILFFALRFYRGKRTARTPMALIHACASFINASNIYSYFSNFKYKWRKLLVIRLEINQFLFLPTNEQILRRFKEST